LVFELYEFDVFTIKNKSNCEGCKLIDDFDEEDMKQYMFSQFSTFEKIVQRLSGIYIIGLGLN